MCSSDLYAGPGFKHVERHYGLTESETAVLFCLGQFPGLRAKDVSAVSGRPKNSISRAVHLLIKKGFIDRAADRRDKREKTLRLTPDGSSVFHRVVPIFLERQEAMLSALNARERKTFDKLLGKLIEGLGDWTKDY